jgi:hypothetical protein
MENVDNQYITKKCNFKAALMVSCLHFFLFPHRLDRQDMHHTSLEIESE